MVASQGENMLECGDSFVRVHDKSDSPTVEHFFSPEIRGEQRTNVRELGDCKNAAILTLPPSFQWSSSPSPADDKQGVGSLQQECSGVNEKRKRNFLVQYFKKKSNGWSKDQIVLIVLLSVAEFFAAAVVSIQAPFYPDIASSKGASATEYGLVFGIFEVVVFIMSPYYGSKMGKWEPNVVFNWGIAVTGVCCIIFGLLDEIQGRVPFIGLCLIVRIVEAMGDAAFDTASFTIIAVEFPDSVATSFSILEVFYGGGLIIGPFLGGVLYELGGYKLPFLSMGGLLLVSAIVIYFFLPEPVLRRRAANGQLPDRTSSPPVGLGGFHVFKMLKILVIAMTAYSIVAVTAGVGFLSANLDIHMKQFLTNKVATGSVFVLNGGVYALTAPIWGWICDHVEKQKLITLTGAIFTILGFVFIGPVPYFPINTTLLMSCIGLSLFGFGLAAILVSAFLQALKDAINHGYPDDITTYGLVSGLWTSMSALGYCIGSSAGGVLDDLVGFRWGSLFIIGTQVVLILMLCGYYVAYKVLRKNAHECERNKSELRLEEDVKNHNNLAKLTPYGLQCSL